MGRLADLLAPELDNFDNTPIGVDSSFFNDIMGILSDPEQTKQRFENTRYFSNKLDMDISTADDLRFAIGSQLGDKDVITEQDITRVIQEIELEEWRPPQLIQGPELGFWGRQWETMKRNVLDPTNIEGRISRGPMLAFLFDDEPVLEAFSNKDIYRKGFVETVKDAKKGIGQNMSAEVIGRVQQIGDFFGDQQIQNWSEMMGDALDKEMELDPTGGIQLKPGTGALGTVIQAVRRPEIIIQSFIEMAPMLAAGYVGGTVGKSLGIGSKAGRFFGISESLVGAKYRNMRKQDVPPAEAFAGSMLQAYGEGGLESWTLTAKIDLFRASFGRAAKEGMMRRGTDIVLTGGKSMGRGFSEEAGAAFNDRLWELVFVDEIGIIDAMKEAYGPEVLEAGGIGTVMELLLSGAALTGGVLYRHSSMVRREAKIAKLDRLIKDVEASDFSHEEKVEIATLILEQKAKVKAGGDDVKSIVLDSEEEAKALGKELEDQAIKEKLDIDITVQGEKVTVKQLYEETEGKVFENGVEVVPEQDVSGIDPLRDIDAFLETATEQEITIARAEILERFQSLTHAADLVGGLEDLPTMREMYDDAPEGMKLFTPEEFRWWSLALDNAQQLVENLPPETKARLMTFPRVARWLTPSTPDVSGLGIQPVGAKQPEAAAKEDKVKRTFAREQHAASSEILGKDPVGDIEGARPTRKQEPWQMTKEEFIQEANNLPKNSKTSEPTPNKFNLGDLLIDDFGENPFVYELQMINTDQIDYSLEGQTRDQVLAMPTTQKYIEWYKQGIIPPPVTVVIKDPDGRQSSINRRRIIAAQEAGVKEIPAFVEIGRHQDIIKQALVEGKPVPAEVLKDYPDLAAEGAAAKDPISEIVKPIGLTKAEQKLTSQKQQQKFREAQVEGESVGFKQGKKTATAAEKEKAKAKLKQQSETFNRKSKVDRERARVAIDKIREAKKVSAAHRDILIGLINAFVPKRDDPAIHARLMAGLARKDQITDAVRNQIDKRIAKGIEKAERKALDKELKALFDKVRAKEMRPEYGNAVNAINEMFRKGRETEEKIDARQELIEFAKAALEEAKALNPDSMALVEARAMLADLEAKSGKVAVADLHIEEVRELIGIMTSLDAMNKQENSILGQGDDQKVTSRQEKVQGEVRDRKEVPLKGGGIKGFAGRVGRGTQHFLSNGHGSLSSISDNIGGGLSGTYSKWVNGKKALTEFVYDVIDKGVDDQYNHSTKTEKLLQEIIKKHGMDPVAHSRDSHKFDMKNAKGNDVSTEFTTNDLLSIYMHSRNIHNATVLNEQGWDRIVGGLTETVRGFTRERIDEMVGTLTAEQKAFAREVGLRLMDGENKDALNETTLLMENRELVTVPHYWPAVRHIIKGPSGKETTALQKLIENMGFLKERVGKGHPLAAKGFYETVYETNKNVAAYVGLAPAMRDVKAVFNADMIETFNVNGWQKEAQAINDIIKRVESNSPEMASSLERGVTSTFAHLRRNFAKSIFGLNTKLWMRQQLSVLLLSAYVHPRHMTAMKGLADAKIITRIRSISPQNRARFDGHRYDGNVGDGVMETEFLSYLTGDGSFESLKKSWERKDIKGALNNAQVAALSGMKFFDTNAIADVFRIAESEVQFNHPDLKVDSTEYNARLKERFEWLVNHTQPVWHVKDRSLIGSSKNELIRQMTMFFSQREVLVRMATSAAVLLDNRLRDPNATAKDKEEAILEASKVYGALLSNVIVFTAFNALFAAIVFGTDDDDERSLTREGVKTIVGSVFFGDVIVEAIRKAEGIAQGKYIRTDISLGVSGVIEAGIQGAGYTGMAAYDAIVGDPDWKKNLDKGVKFSLEALLEGGGLPYTGLEQVTRRLRKNETKLIQRGLR